MKLGLQKGWVYKIQFWSKWKKRGVFQYVSGGG